MYTREEREDDAKKAFAEGDLEKALTSFVRAAELCILRRASEPDEEDKDGNDDDDAREPAKEREARPLVMFASGLHTLFGNIAAVLTKLGRFEEAVAAADHAIFLNPEWAKGYFRKGAALFALEKSHEAVVAYDAGLKVEPDNKDLKQGRELAAKNAANDEAKAKEASKDSKPERETKDTVAGEHSESEKYANELEDFLDGVAPSLARLHAKRKREEEEAIEQIFTDAKELSKTMSGGNKNPKGDRWEDFFCEQRVS